MQERAAQQRSLAEHKGPLGLLSCQALSLLLLLGLRERAQVGHPERDVQAGSDHLHQLSLSHAQGGAQDFVALYQQVEAGFQHTGQQRVAHLNGCCHCIDRATRLQLIKKP